MSARVEKTPADGRYGREPDDEGKVLSESKRSRIVRRSSPDGTVITKQSLGPGAAKRARHEATILKRLSAVPGVSKLSSQSLQGDSIELVDDGGTPLSQLGHEGKLDICALLKLALELTNIIAAVHRSGVVHRDINPSNVLISGAARTPILVNFDIASSFAEERPAFTAQAEISGTIAYIAPEQTGRTGRVTDQRADLYSLGVTLYELATGHTPFESHDPFSIIRDHLAREATAPVLVDANIPEGLSDIIMRLLQKEPDRRYQSAEGLACDLTRLIERGLAGERGPFPLAERDFPQRILPPSRLIGREPEIATLHEAFADARAGRNNGLLVAGTPGVGKTALIGELRALVTSKSGWFVTCKFDQYQHGTESSATRDGLRRLISLLLAESEQQLAPIRARLIATLGSSAPLAAALFSDLALLLEVGPECSDIDVFIKPENLAQIGLDIVTAIASHARPLVFVVDDLQWAVETTLTLFDLAVSRQPVAGLLLIGAYRIADVDATHPLSTILERWQRSQNPVHRLVLQNLQLADMGELLQEMLRLPPREAAKLADAIGLRTDGNPYDTVELIDGLRREGGLVLGPDGWSWEEATIRTFIGQGDVLDLLNARIDALSPRSSNLLEIMACFGGEISSVLLQKAADLNADELEESLLESLEDGLIVPAGTPEPAFRFRHDRVQQAAYDRLGSGRPAIHLANARRLAGAGTFRNVAATQYLAASAALRDPAECLFTVELFRDAAHESESTANYAAAECYLSAATILMRFVSADKRAVGRLVENERLVMLLALGRLEEAEVLYHSIESHTEDALELVDAACVQISSLTSRNRPVDALETGLNLLARIGFEQPERKLLGAAVAERLCAIDAWGCDEAARAADLERIHIDPPGVVAAAKIMSRMMPPAYFCDHITLAWLALEALELWSRYGPRATLVGPISHAGYVTAEMDGDYRIGYRVARHILDISNARGYEPETSQSRFLFALGMQHWFEPPEEGVAQARRAREGLIKSGDLQNACFTYFATIPLLLECAETLDDYESEAEAGIAFARRIGNEQAAQSFLAHRQLARALRGETIDEGGYSDATFDEETHLKLIEPNELGKAHYHLTRAYCALLFEQLPALNRQAAAARPYLPGNTATPQTAFAPVLSAIAWACSIRESDAQERTALFDAIDRARGWLARRADEAPRNFLHAVRWIDAERAWALGDFASAGAAFEAALRTSRERRSPAHAALIAERAGKFYLENGIDRYAKLLLGDSIAFYDAWGATGKARQLKQSFGFLLEPDARGPYGSGQTRLVSSDSIDMMGILSASQALSSQIGTERLKDRVVDLLAALTGATGVSLAIRDEAEWYVTPPGASISISVGDAGANGLLPLTAFRYVERTREALVLADAKGDDRFARDPYFAGSELCSFLAVPIVSQGNLRAILMLENRLGRGAFSASRLDAVTLIAGQLAVSLDNALLYESLEQKVTERTEALATANERLALLSRTDALTGLPNRRHFDQKLESEWQRACRADSSLGVAVIDVDEFKKYNDFYGHPAGDACLQRVAAVLGAGVRMGIDLAARYGGEEFALILPDTALGRAYTVAERIRSDIAALAEPHVSSIHGVVTVSIGVAAIVPSKGRGVSECIRAADVALYEAKRTGRNQVMRELHGQSYALVQRPVATVPEIAKMNKPPQIML